MVIIPLGINGFFSSFGRETMCFTLELPDKLIILDAGSGLFRFAEPIGQKLLQRKTEISIFLSHYHFDHLIGFYAAFQLFQGKKVRVYGYKGPQELAEFMTVADFGKIYSDRYFDFSFHTIDEGMYDFNKFSVKVRRQEHGGAGSLAYRFKFENKKEFAYITDSESSQKSIEFVKNVPLLLHEHYFTGDEISQKKNAKIADHAIGGHVTTIGAAWIAKEAKVGKLCLIHHNPFFDNKQLEKQLQVARKIFPKTELARDLKKINY